VTTCLQEAVGIRSPILGEQEPDLLLECVKVFGCTCRWALHG
jgi:hypothetical protein